MNFLVNGMERRAGMDFNGDGYIGGQGLMGRVERATHIDFNGDNMIGRRPDVFYGNPYGGGYGGYPPMGGGYGGGYGYSPY